MFDLFAINFDVVGNPPGFRNLRVNYQMIYACENVVVANMDRPIHQVIYVFAASSRAYTL